MKRIVRLVPPLISRDTIKEKIICIRGHRERLFNLALERQAEKLICHNYGQGGAGWTFLFGCVHKSIRKFEEYILNHSEFKNEPIVVIGAGCYGLLTAILLARKGYKVRIVADQNKVISSYNGAGFFFPRARKMSTPEEKAIFESCGIESYKTYQEISVGMHLFIKEGATILPAYFSLDIDPGFAPYIQQGLMPLPEYVNVDFGNGKNYEMVEYKTIFLNATRLMDQLQQAAKEEKIGYTNQEILAFNEIPEKIIFNCAGLGAKNLAHDKRVVPVQGHLITLQNQPSLHNLQYMLNTKVVMFSKEGRPRDELIYFAPKGSGILGITFIRGQDSLTENYHEFDRLLQRCHDYFGDFPVTL